MFKIDLRTKALVWIFGDGYGWSGAQKNKCFTLEQGAWPWQQHAPYFTRDGLLVLFNNDNYQAWPGQKRQPPCATNSRAVACRLDEDRLTAKQVWDGAIPGEAPVCPVAMGAVEPLRSGRTLVNYGMLPDNEHIGEITWRTREKYPSWSLVREIVMDGKNTVAFEVRLLPRPGATVGWQSFGAIKVYALPGV